jgi:hypothetical protein
MRLVRQEGINERLLLLSLQQFSVSNFLGRNMTSFWNDVARQQKGDVEKILSLYRESADGMKENQKRCGTFMMNAIYSLHLWWTLARLNSYSHRQVSKGSSKKKKVEFLWETGDNVLCRVSNDVLFESLKVCSSKKESIFSSPKYSEVVMDASVYCQSYWSKGKNNQFWTQLKESDSIKRGKDKSKKQSMDGKEILKTFPENRYDLFWSRLKVYPETIQKGSAPFWILGWLPSVMSLEKEERERYVVPTSVGVWKKPVQFETRKKVDNKKQKKKEHTFSIKMPSSFTEKNNHEKSTALRTNDATNQVPKSATASSETKIGKITITDPVTITSSSKSTSVVNAGSTTTSKLLNDLGNILLPRKSAPLLTMKTDQELMPPQRVMSLSDIIRRNRPNVKTYTTTNSRELVIPSVLKKAARNIPKYQDRLERIQHWHRLGQHKIVNKMIQKALQELMGTSG